MHRFYIFFVIFAFVCLCSCSNKGTKADATNNDKTSLLQRELNSSDPSGNTVIPDATFGNVRIAFLTNRTFKKPSPVKGRQLLGVTSNVSLSTVLVHKSNKQSLKLESEYKGYDYETQVPLSGFKYTARTLPLTLTRSVVIIEDQHMEQLLELAKNKVAFFNHAKSIPANYLAQSNWPTNETILLEQNNRYFALEKPEKMKGEKGKAYSALKYNILLSRSEGHILQILNVRKSRRP